MSSRSARDRMNREVAWRVFATEYNDADMSFKEGDDERAPNYVVTPTAAKINRLFVVGVVTEVENIGEADDLYRARVSDPTGTFMVYAGQYQPDAMSFLAEEDPPCYIAVVGKARTYQPEDSEEVYTSIRPEEINEVDADTRDRWTVETARQTLDRIEDVFSYLQDGEGDAKLHDLGDTVQHYGVDHEYLEGLRSEVLTVLRELSGEEESEAMGSMGSAGEVEEEPGFREGEGSEDDGEDEWEWGDEEREEVEEEYGAEFESAADIEAETGLEGGKESESEIEGEGREDESSEELETTESGGDGQEVGDAEDIVMSIIESENGDEGVERSVIISSAVEEGLSKEVAEDTLEDLLMEGMCYPTDGDRIKPL